MSRPSREADAAAVTVALIEALQSARIDVQYVGDFGWTWTIREAARARRAKIDAALAMARGEG